MTLFMSFDNVYVLNGYCTSADNRILKCNISEARLAVLSKEKKRKVKNTHKMMVLNVLNMFKQNSECKYWFKQVITILLKSVIFFQVFLGQKYGYRPLPTIIDAKELDMMRECVRDVPAEVELLDKWYKKDTNTVPPVYILQPISTILTNFNNKVSKISWLYKIMKTN